MYTTTYDTLRKAKLPFALPASTGKLTRAQLAAPVNVLTILDLYGLAPALQALGTNQANKAILVQLAAAFARRVLPIYEAQYPADNRPRLAIEAAENGDAAYAANAAADAADAADAAAHAAADAADAAAYAAAREDEEHAQYEIMYQLLGATK